MPEWSALTGWDWGVLMVFAVSVSLGLWKGFVRTVFAVLAWLVAWFLAPRLSPWGVSVTGLESSPWVVWIAVFVLLLVLVNLVGWLVVSGLRRAGLGLADRILGALLGAVRALAIIAVMVVAAQALDLDRGAAWKASASRPLFEHLSAWVQPWVPERVRGPRRT